VLTEEEEKEEEGEEEEEKRTGICGNERTNTVSSIER
jgi:hypothetical protein